jgi:hypothetical protein
VIEETVHMPTNKQIAASRANGARSRGPKTPEGKARASRNSTRHGLLARAILLADESRDRFDDLVRLLNASLNPRTTIDELLIGKMAAAHWRQMRIWRLEREGDKSLGDYEIRLDRQFFRTFDRYLRLQTLSSKLRTFFGETNPATLLFPTLDAFSDPEPEPETTQPEPETTQTEPIRQSRHSTQSRDSNCPPTNYPKRPSDPATGDN